jgi:hypothetical protein
VDYDPGAGLSEASAFEARMDAGWYDDPPDYDDDDFEELEECNHGVYEAECSDCVTEPPCPYGDISISYDSLSTTQLRDLRAPECKCRLGFLHIKYDRGWLSPLLHPGRPWMDRRWRPFFPIMRLHPDFECHYCIRAYRRWLRKACHYNDGGHCTCRVNKADRNNE